MVAHALRGWLALLLACVATGAPAQTACSVGTGGTGIDPGTGGTGIHTRDIGTGGTGRQLADPGTGGTGIIGVITGFASVCVNGIEADFDARTAIYDNGKSAGPSSLKVGQVVEVLAVGRGERVFARRIVVNDVMVGPVTRVDPANRRLEIMHQPVRWSGDMTSQAPGSAALHEVKPGQYLRVSGFRAASGEVLASRIDQATPGTVRLTGAVTSVAGRDIAVQGVRVNRDGNDAVVTREDLVRIEGEWRGDAIAATRIAPATMSFKHEVDFVNVQGVLDTRGGALRVGDLRVALDADSRVEGDGAALRSGELVQIEASVQDGGELRVQTLLRGTRVARPARQQDTGDDDNGGDDRDDNGSGDDKNAADDERSGEDGSGKDRADNDDMAERRNDEFEDNSGRDGEEKNATRSDDASRDRERDDDRSRQRADEQLREQSDRGGSRGGREADARERNDGARPDRPLKMERDGRQERVERVDRVERLDRVDRVERVERADRVERIDKPERVQRADRGGRDH